MELIKEMEIKVLNCENTFVPVLIIKTHPLAIW
jgi:hypothetical protein